MTRLALIVGGIGFVIAPEGDLRADATTEPVAATQQDNLPASPAADYVALNPQKTVLLDAKRKRLLLKTSVVQREALLEMFLCKDQTKEHESILAIDSEANVIHAGLLAVGADPGRPVQHVPDYEPPTGQIIDIFVNWVDEDSRPQRAKAQKWIRTVTRRYYVAPLANLPESFQLPEESELRHDPKRGELIWFGQMSEAERDRHLVLSGNAEYQQAIRQFFKESQSREMDAELVFAGSGFFVDEDGKRHYLAESGNLICVANFSDATIDVAAKSSAQGDSLLFEAYTERIPPLETEVTVELIPRPAEKSP